MPLHSHKHSQLYSRRLHVLMPPFTNTHGFFTLLQVLLAVVPIVTAAGKPPDCHQIL